MNRKNLLNYLPNDRPILEIGPYNCPFLLKGEHDVYYADVCTTEELFNGGYGSGIKGLAHIDYSVKGTYKEAVLDKRFAAVFSSHVLEHIPDPIKHLQEIAEILDNGGYVVMCIPDKRLTFDYFREVTPLRDLYDVYLNGEMTLRRLVFDYNFLCDYNHKYGDFLLNEVSVEEVLLAKCRKFDFPTDSRQTRVHYWVFTDVAFLGCFRDLLLLNLLPFTLEFVGFTRFPQNEFHIVLKKDRNIQTDKERREKEILRIGEIVENERNNKSILEDAYERMKKVFYRHENNYIYGVGKIADTIATLANKKKLLYNGNIVSDGFAKPQIFHNHPVRYLSEVDLRGDTGVILALDQKNSAEVRSILSQKYDKIVVEEV